jgi:RNA polymerase sigma-70 factor (ECF subfamily)
MMAGGSQGFAPGSGVDRTRRFTRRPSDDSQHHADLVRPAIARAKEGDPSALHYLYVRYADDVFGYVNSIVRDPHDAEDITQTMFAKLMHAILRYEERDVPFSAWILRVARNASLDYLRARRQIPFEEVRTSEDHRDEQLGYERSQSLRTALEGLPEDQREVLVLRHIGGLSPTEIAQMLGKTEGAVHGLHHRGRKALRRALLELEAGPVTATGT